MSFSATLVDEWVRAGVTEAVVAPGSRSTPLAVALANEPRLNVHVVLDERSASFMALGIGLLSGRPAILLCTSGTAAAHFHGAVIEASQAGVPLIVCTADRPPELQGVGAPQTTDQVGIYGAAVRWQANPGVADDLTASTWRSLASRAFCEATGEHPGPVHLNLMFREPLLDGASAEPQGRADGQPWHQLVPRGPNPGANGAQGYLDDARRVLVVAGANAPAGLDIAGLPVLSDHRAPYHPVIAHWDALLRTPGFADSHLPDLVIRAGDSPASKVLATWLANLDVPQIVITRPGGWPDPHHNATAILHDIGHATITTEPGWLDSWTNASERAAATIDAVLESHREPTEPAVARTLLAALPDHGSLMVSSSMPIRDLEAFATPRSSVTVLANRGANGIDGIVSTATGIALASRRPTAVLAGDLAFLHDTNGLLGLTRRDVNLTLVVIDNDGGGIFSFLPQRSALTSARFESLFGTPQHVDLVDLAATYGISAQVVDTASALTPSLDQALARGGVNLVVVKTDRDANVAVHDELNEAVAAALT